jgi:exportin-T
MQRDCAADTSSPPGFLRNKLAQALVVLVQLQYPNAWPTFFHDMVAAAATGPGLADMFVRILASVDEDIISLEFARWGC